MSDVAAPEPQAQRPGLLGHKKSKRVGVRVDMTPMVDVAFLLLIFFMVTTVFRQPLAMEINLPEPGATTTVPESNVMTIYVDRNESLYVKQGKNPIETTTWDQLEHLFLEATAMNPQLIILVKISRGARYEPMVDMMDTLEDADMQRFSLVPMSDADEKRIEGVQ